jgi:hypothetical protein
LLFPFELFCAILASEFSKHYNESIGGLCVDKQLLCNPETVSEANKIVWVTSLPVQKHKLILYQLLATIVGA